MLHKLASRVAIKWMLTRRLQRLAAAQMEVRAPNGTLVGQGPDTKETAQWLGHKIGLAFQADAVQRMVVTGRWKNDFFAGSYMGRPQNKPPVGTGYLKHGTWLVFDGRAWVIGTSPDKRSQGHSWQRPEMGAPLSPSERERRKYLAGREKGPGVPDATGPHPACPNPKRDGGPGEGRGLGPSGEGCPRTKKKADFETGRLDRDTRRKANAEMRNHGLDGNKRFSCAEEGYAKAVDIMGEYGIELGEVVNSFLFRPDNNTINIDIAFTNRADIFSPRPVTNSMLHVSYTKLADDRYEVLAYLT